MDVSGFTGERDGQKVGVDLGRRDHVGLVLIGECWCREAAAFTVDALVVGQGATHMNLGVNLRAVNRCDIQNHATVIE